MEQIDAKSVRFLNAVNYYGGEANISEIRELAELNRNEVNYRFGKLEDMDLIEVTKEDSPGGKQRKVAHLTGKARQQLERGLGSASNAGLVISEEPEATEVSRERFVEMEKRLEQLVKAKEPASGESEEVDELREQVSWNEVHIRTFGVIIGQHLDVSDDEVEEAFEIAQEKMRD